MTKAKKVTKKKVVKKTVNKTAEKKTESKPEPKEYEIKIVILGKEYTIETDDIKEAILSMKPEKLSGKILFTVRRGNSVAERIIYPFQARKLFINPLTADFFTKNIMLRLK